jgi:hypothetical protein
LRAGVARECISPPSGIYLIGYGDRAKGNRGVHDDLYATALALDDGRTCLALVALDMLCLNEFIVDRVRRAVKPDIQPILCCSHTHSGPIAYADERSPRRNRAYIDALVRQIVSAIQAAARQLVPARFSYGESQAGIAVNRRERTPAGEMIIGENPHGPVDRSVQVLGVQGADGQRLASVVNFACHGTVLGPDNLLVSADWIGAMRAHAEEQLGGLVLFLQGATANLNPAMGWQSEVAWELVRAQGEQVADAVIAAVGQPQGEPLAVAPLGFVRREVPLAFDVPVTSPKAPTDYRRRLLSMAGLPAFMWPLTDWLLARRYPWRTRLAPGRGELEGVWSVPLRMNVARMGALALVSYGSEVFTEIGIQVKAASPAAFTLFTSITDGCIGYLPTAEAFTEGGYEVDTAPYAYRFPGRLASDSAGRALRATQEALVQLFT